MSLTHKEAVDDITLIFKTVWDTTGHEVFYESVRNQREDDNSSWASFSIRHASSTQRTLGGQGNRIFTRTGFVIVSIFFQVGKGLSEGYALAKVVTDVYEGICSPNGVQFRDIRLQEIGRDGQFFQINVLIDFEYDEIK